MNPRSLARYEGTLVVPLDTTNKPVDGGLSGAPVTDVGFNFLRSEVSNQLKGKS